MTGSGGKVVQEPRNRAIVLGAGMAGLLAVRVLSEHFAEVVLVERDLIRGVDGPRRGVPQGRHAHALLARGQQILGELFPGLQEELTAAGIGSCDLAGSLRWYFQGRKLAQQDSGLLSVSATRPELEAAVRSRVLAIPGVVLREGTTVDGVLSAQDGRRVTGVRVRPAAGPDAADLRADLVVDATGRQSRAVQWLGELGFKAPPEDRMPINMAYTTRLFACDEDPYGADLSINSVAYAANPRGAFFPRLHGNVSMLSLTGILGDHPPRELGGFLRFAEDLDAPEIHRTVASATPLDDGVTFRIAASVRRRYERLPAHPDGFLVIGDAVCSFNPVYGQGMTVAAMEAAALQDHLRAGPVDPRQFYRRLSKIIDVPWEVSAGGDLAFPGVPGERPFKVRMANGYINRLHRAAAANGALTSTFFRVAGLVDPPTALFRPRVLAATLRHRVGQAEPPSRPGVAAAPATQTGDRSYSGGDKA